MMNDSHEGEPAIADLGDAEEDLSPEEAKKVVGGSVTAAPKAVVVSEPATPHIPTPNPPKG